MTILRHVAGAFILDLVRDSKNEEEAIVDNLLDFARNSRKVVVLREDEFQAILSLLPKDCNLPTQCTGELNPLRKRNKTLEHFHKIRMQYNLNLEASRGRTGEIADFYNSTRLENLLAPIEGIFDFPRVP